MLKTKWIELLQLIPDWLANCWFIINFIFTIPSALVSWIADNQLGTINAIYCYLIFFEKQKRNHRFANLLSMSNTDLKTLRKWFNQNIDLIDKCSCLREQNSPTEEYKFQITLFSSHIFSMKMNCNRVIVTKRNSYDYKNKIK